MYKERKLKEISSELSMTSEYREKLTKLGLEHSHDNLIWRIPNIPTKRQYKIQHSTLIVAHNHDSSVIMVMGLSLKFSTVDSSKFHMELSLAASPA
ncbi:hypothetical protein PanWU01x14_243210 [Parasponia andersonii]|uniref:Uncharacterized protein n=1 Tax=Parasponia andersonii TaxID=3476 RepID=A0A2P5BFJ7_PARAD|nr:hypothetical protein PanWU01x14_243210 [Parasponia andersonii]